MNLPDTYNILSTKNMLLLKCEKNKYIGTFKKIKHTGIFFLLLDNKKHIFPPGSLFFFTKKSLTSEASFVSVFIHAMLRWTLLLWHDLNTHWKMSTVFKWSSEGSLKLGLTWLLPSSSSSSQSRPWWAISVVPVSWVGLFSPSSILVASVVTFTFMLWKPEETEPMRRLTGSPSNNRKCELPPSLKPGGW